MKVNLIAFDWSMTVTPWQVKLTFIRFLCQFFHYGLIIILIASSFPSPKMEKAFPISSSPKR